MWGCLAQEVRADLHPGPVSRLVTVLYWLLSPVLPAGGAPDLPAAGDKPVKNKAELRAERRGRQEAERATRPGKKGEPGQSASSAKPKAPPSELQPGRPAPSLPVLILTPGYTVHAVN